MNRNKEKLIYDDETENNQVSNEGNNTEAIHAQSDLSAEFNNKELKDYFEYDGNLNKTK